LNKEEFRDAICLHYGWTLSGVPCKCHCGKPFFVNHSMICPTGGFPIIHHNEVQDFTTSVLTEVCPNVTAEPPLLPLSGETFVHWSADVDDGARADLKASSFWS